MNLQTWNRHHIKWLYKCRYVYGWISIWIGSLLVYRNMSLTLKHLTHTLYIDSLEFIPTSTGPFEIYTTSISLIYSILTSPVIILANRVHQRSKYIVINQQKTLIHFSWSFNSLLWIIANHKVMGQKVNEQPLQLHNPVKGRRHVTRIQINQSRKVQVVFFICPLQGAPYELFYSLLFYSLLLFAVNR